MNTTFIQPTREQIVRIVEAHANAVGAPNVRVPFVMQSIDIAYPNIPSHEFEAIRDSIVVPTVQQMKSAALAAAWE